MDAYWCEACVVAGNHPGPEALSVGINDRVADAARAYASGRLDQDQARQKNTRRKAANERMRRRYRSHALELGLLESLARWIDDRFGRR